MIYSLKMTVSLTVWPEELAWTKNQFCSRMTRNVIWLILSKNKILLVAFLFHTSFRNLENVRPLSAKSILPLQFYALSQVGINLKYGSFPIDGKFLVELLSLVSPRVLVRQHSTHYQKRQWPSAMRNSRLYLISKLAWSMYNACIHQKINTYLLHTACMFSYWM